MAAANPELEFVLKVASRCNLDCSYCYVYNKGDSSWRTRPRFLSDEVLSDSISRIRRYVASSGQPVVRVLFHGGEPTLLGHELFGQYCTRLQGELNDLAHVRFSLQTNGTLLDERWLEALVAHDVDVGISIDGPPEIHDAARVDHRGRGSYDRVKRGIQLLHSAGRPVNLLSVIQFGADPLAVHRHLVSLGAHSVHYLLPDYTHDTIEPVRRTYGEHPCADYLIPVFDDWWRHDSIHLKIPLFWNIARLILGGDSRLDMVGNRPFHYVFVEADGAIEGLDVLRVCATAPYGTGLNVRADDFADIAERSPLHRAAMFDGVPLPTGCRACPERRTCAGGYLPHRYSAAAGFDNPTVWCADMLALFGHIRTRLDVDAAETRSRRAALQDAAGVVSGSAAP